MNEEELETLIEEMETELEIQGAVSIEDKLSDEVPEAIELLRMAGIKVVMATGDKVETAINIGIQTRIVPEGADIVRFDCEGKECEM